MKPRIFLQVVEPISEKEEALIQSSMKGDIESVKRYVQEGVNFNAIHKEYGDTALSQAAFKGHIATVNFFITLNLSSYNKNISLILASQAGHSEIADLLLKIGAEANFEVNTPLFYYQPALHQAITHNKWGVFKKLIASDRMDLNFPNKDKQTPLMLACFFDRFEMLKNLIEVGADLNKKNGKDQTALDIAIEKNHSSLIEYIQSFQIKRANGF